MSNRQLEQLRETLDLIVEDLCHREQAVDQEQAHLVERLNELDERQSHLKSLEEVVTAHQASESQLAARLETLVAALDERTAAQPQWMSGELEKLEQRLIESLLARWPQTAAPPTLHELSLEMERTQSKSVQTLT
ncbi:MAG: hypothetical protein IT423_04930, partial [Pirellulaceae bacterium]|nr:hypothetical protein [Pirellulaceae bacterium]